MNFKSCHRYATCYPNLINSQSYGNKSRLFDTPIFSVRSVEVSGDPYLFPLAYFRLEFATGNFYEIVRSSGDLQRALIDLRMIIRS